MTIPLGKVPDLWSSERITVSTRSSAISAGRYTVAPEAETCVESPEIEDAFLAIYQLRDHVQAEFWQNGKKEPAVLQPKGSLHILDLGSSIRVRHIDPVDNLHVHIPRAALEDIARDKGVLPPGDLRVPVAWATMDDVIQQIESLLLGALSGAHARLSTDHLLLFAVSHLAATYGRLQEPQRQGGLAPWQEQRAKEMIASDLAGEQTLSQVAEACRLSSCHFSRAFKVSTGMTPHEWLQRARVEQARARLRTSDTPLSEISLACGFADQSHFTRVFKKATGRTPGAWRDLRAPS